MRSILIILFLFSARALAILAPGEISLRQDVWYMTAFSYWIGQELKAYDGGAGRCQAWAGSTSGTFGVGHGWQIDLRVAYQQNHLTAGNVFRHVPGDRLSGLSEVGFRLTREIGVTESGNELNAFLGFRAPGNPDTSANDFLAINDGAVKADVGMDTTLPFGVGALTASLRYTVRSEPSFDQVALDLLVPFYVSSRFQVGPSTTLVHTLGGVDINGLEFLAISDSLGGGIRLPFPRVKEQVVAAGAFAAYAVTENLSVDLDFRSKLAGRNTDKGSSLALGLNYLF